MSTLKVWSSSPIINFDQLKIFGSDSKVQLPFLVLLEVRRREETSDGSIDFLQEKNVGFIIDYRDFYRKSPARLFQLLGSKLYTSILASDFSTNSYHIMFKFRKTETISVKKFFGKKLRENIYYLF